MKAKTKYHNCVNWSFFDAIDGETIDKKTISGINNNLERKLGKGEIGCALSHIAIWKDIVKKEIPYQIVLEDDIIFHPDFCKVMNDLEMKLSKNVNFGFDILLLGHHSGERKKENIFESKIHRKKINANFDIAAFGNSNVFGLYGYLVTKEGAKKLLNEVIFLTKPIDHYTRPGNKICVKGVSPQIVFPDERFSLKDSNIENERDFYKKKFLSSRKDVKLRLFLQRIKLYSLLKKIRDFVISVKAKYWSVLC